MPNYDFQPLSPPDFELLAGDLLQAALGLTFERFGPGRDKGIDLRCSISEQTVVQCKHYFRAGPNALRSNLRREVLKWKSAQAIDRYILVTSVPMNVYLKEQICDILGTALPIQPADVFGLEDLNSLLEANPDVERRHFKLWINSTTVLDRFIRSEFWSRTEDLLETIEGRAQFFVQTNKYSEALDILDKQKVCIIVGPPGVGKSLLAEMLLLTHSHDGYQVIPISSDAGEGFSAWDQAARQIFYYDDFLGQTSYSEVLTKNEDLRLDDFISRIQRSEGKKFILTTREQILRDAQSSSDRIRRANRVVGHAVLSVGDYSMMDKGQILYNHIYFSRLSEADRLQIVQDEKYLDFIQHRNYSPRIVEQVLRRSDDNVEEFYTDLAASLANPEELWISSFEHLSAVGKAILYLMISYPTAGVREAILAKQLAPLETSAYMQALRVLEGTWLRIRTDHLGETWLEFANPSCRDYILYLIANSPMLSNEVVDNATTVERLALLHRYATSRPSDASDGAPDCLTAAFSRLGYALVEKFQSLYSAQSQAVVDVSTNASSKLLTTRWDRRPALLGLIIPAIREFESTATLSWIRSEVEAIINESHVGLRTDTEDLLRLSSILVRGSEKEMEIGSDLMDYLIGVIDTWDELIEFKTLADDFEIDLTSDNIQSVANSIFDYEVDHYRFNCSDPEELGQAALDISSAAQDFGLDFSSEAERLEEKAAELTPPDLDGSDRIYRPEPIKPPEISEREAVRELFQGLVD